MKGSKKRPGRPKIPKSQKRRHVVRFKITDEELAAYERSAGTKDTRAVNRWARKAANEKAGVTKP